MQQDVPRCMRHRLSPLRGWGCVRAPTHGLRHGLHSSAASRLQQENSLPCATNATNPDLANIDSRRSTKDKTVTQVTSHHKMIDKDSNRERGDEQDAPMPEATSRTTAPKERKNTAHGASHGWPARNRAQPLRGGRKQRLNQRAAPATIMSAMKHGGTAASAVRKHFTL